MEITDIKEKDGFTEVVLNMTEDEHGVLLRAGLSKVADDYKPGGYKVLPPEYACGKVTKVEISDEMADWLVKVAVSDALDKMIKKEEKDVDSVSG